MSGAGWYTGMGTGGGESAGSTLDRQLAAREIDEDTYRRLREERAHTG